MIGVTIEYKFIGTTRLYNIMQTEPYVEDFSLKEIKWQYLAGKTEKG